MARAAEYDEKFILEKAKQIRADKKKERNQERIIRNAVRAKGGRPTGATEKIGVRMFISQELADFIQTRAAELKVPQSQIVEAALRDRLGMRQLFDIEQVLANA